MNKRPLDIGKPIENNPAIVFSLFLQVSVFIKRVLEQKPMPGLWLPKNIIKDALLGHLQMLGVELTEHEFYYHAKPPKLSRYGRKRLS